MRLISLDITLLDEEATLDMPALTKAFGKFAKEVMRRARISLAKSGKNSTGNLSDSLASAMYVDKRTNKITLDFNAPEAPYWEFVDQGVKGSFSKKKAPYSPFQFGSGTGESGGLRNGIREWIANKPIKQWKSTKSGRFMSYDQMTHLISRAVFLYGIAPTYFYSGSLERTFKKYKGKLEDAIFDDYEVFFEENFSNNYTIEITI